MTTWITATRDLRCGACGRVIPTGERLLVRQVPEVKRQFLRCAMCAEEADPTPPAPSVKETS